MSVFIAYEDDGNGKMFSSKKKALDCIAQQEIKELENLYSTEDEYDG